MRSLLVILCGCSLMLGAAERVTIKAGSTIRADADRVIGINTNYLTDSQRRSNDPEHAELIAALRRLGPAWLRFPGGEKSDSHAFAAPPYATSAPVLLRQGPGEWPAIDRRFTDGEGEWLPGREPMNFDEFMGVCRAVGAEPLIVLPYDAAYRTIEAGGRRPTIDELVEHAAAWVRYANIERDYGVVHWTLGNETDYKATLAEGNPGAEQYARDLQLFARAMRAVDPDIRLGAQGHSQDWFATVLREGGDAVDFLDVHSYAGWNWNDGYRRYLDTRPDLRHEVRMAIRVADEAGRAELPVILSEMGVHDWAGAWRNRNDLAHALVLADMIGQLLTVKRLQGIVYWNTRWVDYDLVSLPLGPDLLAPVGIDLDPEDWQPGETTGDEAVAEAFSDSRATGVQLRGAVVLSRRLPPGLLDGGESYTLEAHVRPERIDRWCGVGIDLLRDGEKIAGHAIEARGTNRWWHKQVSFRVPDDCDGARLWLSSSDGTGLRVADMRLRRGVEPASLDALGPEGGLLASAQVLALWKRMLTGDLVRCESSGDLRAWASGDGEGVRLLLLNPLAEETQVDLVFVDKSCEGPASREIFGGGDLDDLRPATSEAEPVVVEDGRATLGLPGRSLTLLRCRKIKNAEPDP